MHYTENVVYCQLEFLFCKPWVFTSVIEQCFKKKKKKRGRGKKGLVRDEALKDM